LITENLKDMKKKELNAIYNPIVNTLKIKVSTSFSSFVSSIINISI